MFSLVCVIRREENGREEQERKAIRKEEVRRGEKRSENRRGRGRRGGKIKKISEKRRKVRRKEKK